MKTAVIPLCLAFDLASTAAFSQASDNAQPVHACTLMEPKERVECLNRSQTISPPTPPTGNWIISETVSPLDYTPVVLAVTSSRTDHESFPLQLSLACRGGRTEFVIADHMAGHPEEYTVTYRINDGASISTAAGRPFFGSGTAFKTDVVRLLQSFPDDGSISVQLTPRTGRAREGQFSLHGFKVVREKLASACKWPQAIAGPRN